MGHVRHQRIFHRAYATVFHRCVAPGVVGEMRIDGNANYFNIAGFELFDAMIESDQLRGANKREVQRIKENHRVLTFHGFLEMEIFNNTSVT